MVKLSLSDIKAQTTGHFFDKSTMRFFSAAGWPGAKQQTKYRARYDKETDSNYVEVTDPWGNAHYHKLDETDGSLSCVLDEDIPKSFLKVS